MTSFTQKPTAYPFPDDDLLYVSNSDATVGEDSWFALARLDDAREDQFGNRTHRNTHRFTIHSPLRGSTSYLVNRHDAQHVIAAMLALLADDGADENRSAPFNPRWYTRQLSGDHEVDVK